MEMGVVRIQAAGEFLSEIFLFPSFFSALDFLVEILVKHERGDFLHV
jgi:hypothetical protein